MGGGAGDETLQPRDPPSHGLPSRVGLVVPGVKCLPPPPRPPPVGVEGGGRRGGEGLAQSPGTEHPRGGARGRSHTPQEPLFSPGLQPEVRTCGSLYRAGSNSSSRVLQTTPGARHRGTPQRGLGAAPAGSTFRGRPQSLPPVVPMPGRHPAPASSPPRSHQCGIPSPQISLCGGRRGFCSVTGP